MRFVGQISSQKATVSDKIKILDPWLPLPPKYAAKLENIMLRYIKLLHAGVVMVMLYFLKKKNLKLNKQT